jgi:hypothetical protein
MIVNKVVNFRFSDEILWHYVTTYLLHFLLSSGITLLIFCNFASHNLNAVDDNRQGNLNVYIQHIFFFVFLPKKVQNYYKAKVHPCTRTEALYRPYSPQGEERYSSTVQARRVCTGRTAHRGSRGIALLYRHWGSVQAVRPIGGVEV